jgi:Protein of unknown function (DUF3551)
MRKLITAGMALSAVFVALTEKVHAYVNYPWCVQGETRGMECVFSTKEQCAQDGRGRGFGSQCIRNPTYNPALGSVGERVGVSVRPVRHRSHKHTADQ